ncbi:MAG: hypothetical protein PUA83_01620 [Clostridiales bacterium]|nr:hypothetical protein [Clostridiales bacterium]
MTDLFDENIDIWEKVKKVFAENGIYSDEIMPDEYLDLDSLTLVSLLVCLENELDFVFPDEYLYEIPQTFRGLFQLVLNCIVSPNSNEKNTLNLLEGGIDDEEKA